MVRRIARDFHPDMVVLFGSHGRGDATCDSDVDLLVVLPLEGSKRDEIVAIRTALRDFHVPMDILVSTPEEYRQRKDVVGTIEYSASREGEVVYAL